MATDCRCPRKIKRTQSYSHFQMVGDVIGDAFLTDFNEKGHLDWEQYVHYSNWRNWEKLERDTTNKDPLLKENQVTNLLKILA